MAFCKKCGEELEPDIKFCEKCGSPVVIQPAPPVPSKDPAEIPKWQIFAPYISLVVSIFVSWNVAIGIGLIISACGVGFGVQNYRVRKTGMDVLSIVVAAIGLFINFIFLMTVE